mgnify:CR=1 FL=1
MRRATVLGSIIVLTALTLGGVARADGPSDRCRDVTEDGTFLICGEPDAPRAVYVLPRARPEHRRDELRRTFTDEIVRSGARL